MTSLPPHRAAFLQTCITAEALKFGSWTLKSGRISPYFFNAGIFHRADLLRSISTAYAVTLSTHSPAIEFDVLFGPAYKGIPLATATVDKLAELDPGRFGSVSYSFNRKEAKDHGEGGSIVGSSLKGKRVVIVDDVITAGTAIREAIEIIRKEGGQLVGIIVALDRLEKTPQLDNDGRPVPPELEDDQPRPSAIGQLRKQYGIPIFAILTLDDVMNFAREKGAQDDVTRLEAYRAKYRAID